MSTSNSFITPATLFKIAAALNLVSRNHHAQRLMLTTFRSPFQDISNSAWISPTQLSPRHPPHPSTRSASEEPKQSGTMPMLASSLLVGRFSHPSSSTDILALLNYQWSMTGGPRTREEKAMLWTLLVSGYAAGYRYFEVGAYGPLSVYWLAPTLSAAALQLK